MTMAQIEEDVGDITSIPLCSKRTSDSIVPAQAEHQRVASSSSVSDPSTTAVPHLLSPARDSINGNITPQATKQDDASNRVQVLCRFRCSSKIDGHKACMSSRGAFDEVGNSGRWLQFGELREEEHNHVSGGAGRTRRALETVSIRTGYEWSRRAFDRVFKPDASQGEVYEELRHVAHGVAQGFNGTIFAYGQTGSGKTYTMGGAETTFMWAPTPGVPGVAADELNNADSVHDDVQDATATTAEALPEEAGVIPRAVSTVLADAHARREQGWEFVLSATYVEIYNERIRDLLNPANDNLKVSEHPARGIEAVGATEVRVYSMEEAVEVLMHGAQHRMTAPTLINQVSSRSHTIFTLRLDQRDVVRDCMVSGRLTLVDLAGSERAGKSGAEGRRLEEANSINVSLHTLGRVIRALSLSTSHVPFRDSKLTRLLQESLGGNSRTVLIVCCSHEESQAQETLSTLKFGECAKRVSTFASANVVAAPNEVAAQLSELRAEVVRLKRQLHNYQLRETRRYEATAQAPRRSKHSRRAILGGYSPQDRITVSPNGANYAAGVGDPMARRWGAGSLFDRTVSFNASFTAGGADGSSGDEYWTGPVPRNWDQNDPNGWVDDADEVDESSPSGTTQGWMTVVDGQSPSVASPTNSVGATQDSREDANGGSDDHKGGASNGVRRRYRRGNDRRLWAETPDYVDAQRRRAATNGAVVIDEDCSTPNTGRTGSSGDVSADYRRPPWNPGRQEGSQEGSREGSAEGSWEAEGSDPVYREEDERQEGTQAYKHAVPGLSPQARIAVRSASGVREELEGNAGARARGKHVADSAANGGPDAGIESLDQGGTGGDAAVVSSSTCGDDASEEVSGMHLAFARLEKLEKGWKDRIAEYEKLLQLKDLRIQSLMSVYRSGSSELREAVNAKLGGASTTPPEVAPASTVGTNRAPPGGRKASSGASEQHGLVGHSRHGEGEEDEDGAKRAARRMRRTAVSKRRSPSATDGPVASKLEDGTPSSPPPPSPSRKQDQAIDTRVVYTSTGGH